MNQVNNGISPEILAAARAKLDAARGFLSQPPQKKLSLADIIAQQKQAAAGKAVVVEVPTRAALKKAYATHSVGNVAYNEKQNLAITSVLQGKSICLIGAAGTGKTTTVKGAIGALQANNLIEPLESSSKYLQLGAPGIVFVSYTRRAVRQIAKQVPPELSRHALTIHKLLEFAPVQYEITGPDGEPKRTMRFEPQRHATNPLPRKLKRVIVDESSMVSTELFEQLRAALPRDCQFIFLGDMHQLPPVYGESILANKLMELATVELTEVYRQAMESPIIKLATMVKNGESIPLKLDAVTWNNEEIKSKVKINPWKTQLSKEDAMDGLAGTIKKVITSGNFNEEEDVILMPFNKVPGTLELNLHIANTLGLQRGAVVHHIIAGYLHWYLAIGDRLLVDKQDCVLRGIERNGKYVGKAAMEPAVSLDRWGAYQDDGSHNYLETSNEDIDDLLERMSANNVEDKVNQASHVLVLENLDTGGEVRISEVGTINGMVFSYALTVHKSQGSEWRRVFLFLHSSHHSMCSRELVYTAVTRAREELIIICEPDRRGSDGTLTKAAKNPRIKGDTLKEKLEWLKARSKERMKDELSEM